MPQTSTGFDSSQIAQKALTHLASRVESSKVESRFTGLSLSFAASPPGDSIRSHSTSEEGDREEWEGVGGSRQIRGVSRVSETEARSTSRVPSCRTLSTALPDGCFSLRLRPAFSETFDHFLHTGRLAPGPDDLQRLCKLLKGWKGLTPSM